MISETENNKYQRQIFMPEIGVSGQERLKSSTVVIAGAGGLGCAVSTYLAVAGVGRIIVIDKDIVEPTNLNRQILHFEKDIGRIKSESAVGKLRELNSKIIVLGINAEINNDNYNDLFKDAELILDCLDNFETRLVLNRASLELNIPLIHGACYGFEGRVSLLIPGKTACLGCFIREIPPVNFATPVIGVTPGIIGIMQATEAIKYLTGISPTLEGKLLIYDGKDLEYKIINIPIDPDCKYCGR